MNWFIILIIIVVFAAGIYLLIWMKRFMPKTAEKRAAQGTDNGEIYHINGFDIWVKNMGQKNKTLPCYVIPGGMGMKSSYLEKGLQFLSKTNQTVFYDPRGCGRSQSKSNLNHYKWSEFSQELFQLIQTLTPNEKVCLLAHSCGSAILYEFLEKHGNIVEKVILLSAMPVRYEAKLPNLRKILVHFPPANPHRANKWFSQFIRNDVMFGGMFFNRENIKKLDTSDTSMVLFTNINLRINKSYDHTGHYQNFLKDVFVICGNDRWESNATGRKCAEKIKTQFPKTKTKYFDYSGHFPFIEEPEKFKKTIHEFIKDDMEVSE